MSQQRITIYALLDDRKHVRYIGKSVDVKTRIANHRLRFEWFYSFLLLEITTSKRWAERERYWIAYGREHGWRLENRSRGGDGTQGFNLSEQHRRRIGLSMKGNKNTSGMIHRKETKDRMSISARLSWTPDRRARQSGVNHPRPCRGKKPWNAGLTKLSDSRVAANGRSIALALIGNVPWNKGLRKVNN